MQDKYRLFILTLRRLADAGILDQILLIGGWCLYIYRDMYNNDDRLPLLRTADIDLLITNPRSKKQETDLIGILEELGYEQIFHHGTGYSKFSHPDLDIEFLYPARGAPSNKPLKIKEWHISALGLTYMEILTKNQISVSFQQLQIQVPDSAAFALHKVLLSVKRKDRTKRSKDLATGIELLRFLHSNNDRQKKIREIFHTLPNQWQKAISKQIVEFDELKELFQ